MCLNKLYRTLYFNNTSVFNRFYASFLNKNIFQKECANSSAVFNDEQCSDLRNIKSDKLRLFNALRQNMIATGKYTISEGIHNCKLADLKLIKDIKLETWTKLSISDSIKKFTILSNYAMKNNYNLSSDDYSHVILTLKRNLVRFSDDELMTLLRCLKVWPNISDIRTLNVRNLLKTIDSELIERSKLWSNKKTLLYCDIICKFYNFYSNFVTISLTKLTSECSKLNSTEIVHIMCILFIYSLPKVKLSQLEYYIEKYFDLFEIAELQIICLGFFISQAGIDNKILLQHFLRKIIYNVNDFSDNDLSAFLKLLRYNFVSKPDFLKLYEQLFECLIPIVPHVNILVVTQLSHLKARSLIYNSVLMSAIIKRFSECLNTSRIKDIERFILLLTTFNYSSHEPVYKVIIAELRNSRRRIEKRNFPKEYGFTLRHLMQVNVYPLDLISYVMGEEYKKLVYGQNSLKIGIENFVLDQSLKIECPDYKGQQLDSSLCKYMLNKYNDMECDYTFGSKANQQIIKLVNEMYGKKVAFLYRVLPHFTQQSIVLCFDHNNNAISSLSLLKDINSDIKWVPFELKEKYFWLALVFATETVIIRNTKQFSGYLCSHIRQLEKVGYTSIVIPYFEWITFGKNKERQEYLMEKILSTINLKRKTN